MSIYANIEQAIADRLSPFGGLDFDVRVLPENQSEYGQRAFNAGRITVAYHSSKFMDHNSIGAGTSQFEKATFAIAIESRTLREAKGVYNIASIIRRYLVGFSPSGETPLKAEEFGLKEATHEDNLWTYYAYYSTVIMAVEDVPDDPSALFNEITLLQNIQ